MTEIVPVAQKLLAEKLLVRSWGNISARIDEEHFRITPSGRDYRKLTEADMVVVDLAGNYAGDILPSSEKALHAGIYRRFPEAQFVIHTHQNFASAWSMAGEDLDLPNTLNYGSTPLESPTNTVDRGEPETFLGALVRQNGSAIVPVTRYAVAGSDLLVKEALSGFERSGSRSVLLAGHGAAYYAADPKSCMALARAMEVFCEQLYRAAALALPQDSLDDKLQILGRDEPAARGFSVAAAESKGQLLSRDPQLRAGVKTGISAYLEDFAQMFGPTLDSKSGPSLGVLETTDGLIFLGADLEDARNRHDIILKNFLAAQVAEQAHTPPLPKHLARAMQKNYRDYYSQLF